MTAIVEPCRMRDALKKWHFGFGTCGSRQGAQVPPAKSVPARALFSGGCELHVKVLGTF